MNHQKRAVVDPPDSRGLREVRLDGVTVGRAWSLRELRRLLTRSGFSEKTDPAADPAVFWYGGGPDTWPDQPLQRRTTMVLLVVGLLGSAVLLVDIGYPDLFGALTFAGRITGWMFIVGGFLQALAAVAAFDHWSKRSFKYSGAFALFGVIITLVVCSLLLALWLQEREYFPYCLSYLSLWVWSLWATWRVSREKPWRGIPHPRGFALGAVASGLVAAMNLAYSGLYQPTTAVEKVHYHVAFGIPYASPDAHKSIMYVPVTVTLENTGTVPFWILASVVKVYSTSSKFRPKETSIHWREGEGESQLYTGPPITNLVYWGSLEEPGGWLDPGLRSVRQKILQLPRDAPFDSLEASSDLMTMRKDRGSIGSEFNTSHWSWEPDEATERVDCATCGDIGINLGPLRYNSNLLNVTRKPRHVLSVRYVNDDVEWDYEVAVSPLDERGKISGDFEPEGRFDFVQMGAASATVSFAQLLKQLR
ncbi:Yip1 family protein [Streptomyces erythrochromogenes]|uniref:Yip1 family protein n=1 Tax=Streptomyces erythrochromogenes TaxID=285574 RepID=UPI0002F2EA40